MKRRTRLGVGAASLCLALFATPGRAGQLRPGEQAPKIDLAAQEAARGSQQAIHARRALQAPDQFGTQCCQVLQIPAAAFTPISGAVPTNSGSSDDPYVYVSAYGTSFYDLWAPVTLPTGAALDYVDLFYYDADSSVLPITARLVRFYGGGLSGPPGSEVVATVASTGDTGFGYSVSAASGTIQNEVVFNPDGGQYVFQVTFPSTDGTASFKGIDIWWHRQVSPAPVTQSFLDVPPSDFGFQFIEAMKASGITGGCGDGTNYCPTDPVTRRQMAIFIAKALGLYWQY